MRCDVRMCDDVRICDDVRMVGTIGVMFSSTRYTSRFPRHH